MHTALFTKVLEDRSVPECLEIAADIGYDGIEILCDGSVFPPEETSAAVERIAETAASVDVDVVGLYTHTGQYVDADDESRWEEIEALERYCEIAAELDCSFVVHHEGGPSPTVATAADYATAAEWYARAADRAAEYGLDLGIEIHPNSLAETVRSTLTLLTLIDRHNVGAIHDAGNMFITGTDYGPESVITLGEDLLHVHVKDLEPASDTGPSTFHIDTPAGERRYRHTLLTEGAVDHRPLFGALKAHGYEGGVTCECHSTPSTDRTDRDIARHEHETVRSLLAEETA
jgi:sugar phosphate isomerase/epimerase